MPKVSGFTFVRNAVKLDFPLEASIRSILPLCDEVVVNVGRSEDDTLGLVRSLNEPKIRIIESEWDLSRGRSVLADQTEIARKACRFPWGVYIQADEVLHESGIENLRRAIAAADADPRIEGLVVRYVHLYGGLDTEMTGRQAYRREVRVLRLDPAFGIHSYLDAQGFRVGAEDRRLRCRLVDAEIFHYGWARPAEAIRQKWRTMDTFWWNAEERSAGRAGKGDRDEALLPWVPGLRSLGRAHPAVAAPWVESRRRESEGLVGPPAWTGRMRRHAALDWVERMTGARLFEFRNYTVV